MTVFRRAVGLAKPSTRLLVARASSERSTSAGVTPSPDPNFETFEPAGSHPIKPTTEYVNILDNDIIKGSEYNPLQEIVPKKANVSQEALDSVFPPKPELSVKKPDTKAPKS
eukprot:Phypoly_transcript_26217.p1 GENE.Phypoly_transcript_26217~~Phypoly_transcript_26217.p1  ORF type:complete len:126 (+),score=30.32 Phypoly_transcript_26217:44-379(+)